MMLHTAMRRSAAFGLGAALAVLLLPALVTAHSELVSSDPTDGSTVTGPFMGPVVLTFSDALAQGSKAELYGPGSTNHGNEPITPTKAKQMTISFDRALQLGSYRAEWVSIASDGDLLRGTVFFTVAAAPTPSPIPIPTSTPTTSAAATAPTPSPSAAATPAPSAGPTPAPSSDGDTTGSGGDVVLPIVVALILLGAGAAYLLSRRNRPPDPT